MPTKGIAQRLKLKICRLAGLLIILWAVINGFRPMMDNVDLGWHVAQGRWMLEHFSFYRADAFNYPNLGHPVVDEYPLFQIVLALFWSLGWIGPCLLTSIVYGLLAWIILRAGKDFDLGASALLCVATGLMFFYLNVAFPLRPHMVTYLCIAVLGIFLLRYREPGSWKVFWPMALLQVAWVNSHSAFVIGPAMIALFGAEMTLRSWIRTKDFPARTAATWLVAVIFISAACLINPYGWSRLTLPFYHDQLESIRAYVGEMQPLYGGRDVVYGDITVVTLTVLVLGLIGRMGGTAYSFVLLAVFFLWQAQSVQKAWPVFGVFVPLIVLGVGCFGKSALKAAPRAWLNLIGSFGVGSITAFAILFAFTPWMPNNIASQWREFDAGRSEMSWKVLDWLTAFEQGKMMSQRIFHRCEDGGLLQQAGFTATFADTGFGKFDEAYIHEIGLVNERPALLLRMLRGSRCRFVVCSNFCYEWPYYLNKEGWQLEVYTPNSSVWSQRATIYIKNPRDYEYQVADIFDKDLEEHGLPANLALHYRNIIALNSYGLGDFAFAKLTELPSDQHRRPEYWEAATIMCFNQPPMSAEHRAAFLKEAVELKADSLTAEFRARCFNAAGDTEKAFQVLKGLGRRELHDGAATLLLKLELDRNDPGALDLARDGERFNLRNGRHWMYLAMAEERAKNLPGAAAAWRKAVFYYPDDEELMREAAAFAAKNSDAVLQKDIADSDKVYGATP